jgi:hypothetical protein
VTNEEFTAKYGEVELKFCSYYKYQFFFTGTAPDGTSITACYGGSSDEIYRYGISHDSVHKVGRVEDHWMNVGATKDEKIIFEYNDY